MIVAAGSAPGYIMKMESGPNADQIKVFFQHTMQVSKENKQLEFIKSLGGMNCSILGVNRCIEAMSNTEGVS